jgi:adenosylcobinamide kinase/adenosylcobinamide-phosphate guanylyltransferase
LKNVLLTGGARSGKSRLAQELAAKAGGQVLFVATATAGDDDMRKRIEEHRKTRPNDWKTLEVTTHLGSQIAKNSVGFKTIIIDCITLLINNIFEQCGPNAKAEAVEKAVIAEIDELIACMKKSRAKFIIVTNEVGLGIVPGDPVSRLYRDLLGKANQMLAFSVDEVYLLVAGIEIPVKKA